MGLSAHAVNLRSRTREALAAGGLPFQESHAQAYLEQRFARTAGNAAEINDRLSALVTQDDHEIRTLLEAVPAMVAFADSVMESAYLLLHGVGANRAKASRALAAYVIGSAIFDHASDDDADLLREIGDDLTETSLRGVVAGEVIRFGVRARTPLARAFWLLVNDFAKHTEELARARSGTVSAVREQLAAVLVGAYRGTLESGRNTRLDVWASPLYVAYLLLRLAGDARSAINPVLEQQVERTSDLLRHIDDVTDIEDDWSSGSRNELLDVVRIGEDRELPWGRLLAEGAVDAHVGRTRLLAASVAEMPCAPAIGAWLYYWLYS